MTTRNPFSFASLACSNVIVLRGGCFHREGSTGANVRVNELLKFAVHAGPNVQGNAPVRAGVQLSGTVVSVEHVVGEIREGKY